MLFVAQDLPVVRYPPANQCKSISLFHFFACRFPIHAFGCFACVCFSSARRARWYKTDSEYSPPQTATNAYCQLSNANTAFVEKLFDMFADEVV